MKLKNIAAAALAAIAAVASFSANADIGRYEDAELFVVVFDEDRSYALDTGYSMNTFLAQANTPGFTWSVNMGSMFSSYTALDTNLFDGTKETGTRWVLAAVDVDGGDDANAIGAMRLLTSINAGSSFNTVGNDVWVNQQGAFDIKRSEIGGTGTHATPYTVANNGESVNLKGSAAYWDMMVDFNGTGVYMGNAVNQSSAMVVSTRSSDYDGEMGALETTLAGVASFNGTTLSYSVAGAPVPAVPEPGSLALVAAGLGAMGFIARRRRFN